MRDATGLLAMAGALTPRPYPARHGPGTLMPRAPDATVRRMHHHLDLDAVDGPVDVGVAAGDTLTLCFTELAARDDWRVVQCPDGIVLHERRVRPGPWRPVPMHYHTLSVLVHAPTSGALRLLSHGRGASARDERVILLSSA